MGALEQLYGENAGVIMAAVTDCIKEHNYGYHRGMSDQYRKEAMSGDYANLIEVSRTALSDLCGIETAPYNPTVTVNGIPKEWLEGCDE